MAIIDLANQSVQRLGDLPSRCFGDKLQDLVSSLLEVLEDILCTLEGNIGFIGLAARGFGAGWVPAASPGGAVILCRSVVLAQEKWKCCLQEQQNAPLPCILFLKLQEAYLSAFPLVELHR
jgi:hypothetical protein